VTTQRLILVVTGVLLVLAVWNAAWLLQYAISQVYTIGVDYRFYIGVADRWLETGDFYMPFQLAGPYVMEAARDNVYPPLALYLFLPFGWLPAVLWWVIPCALTVLAFARMRPPRWSWPLLALIAWYPGTQVAYIFGNTAMWLEAAVAWGCLLGWPAVLAILKTSALPFALLGVTRRSWWVAAALLIVVSLPLVQLWFDYVRVVQNTTLDLGYSVTSYPVLLAPVLASSEVLLARFRASFSALRSRSNADHRGPDAETSPGAS
jgi:hypothetical protein